MNPLQKKLKEIQGKYGQDVFLDEGRLAAELKLHFTITKKSVEPVLWCARNFVYFKAYADQDSDHLWFYRYSLLQQMKRELDVPRQDAEEAVDAWIGLAGQHKKAEGL